MVWLMLKAAHLRSLALPACVALLGVVLLGSATATGSEPQAPGEPVFEDHLTLHVPGPDGGEFVALFFLVAAVEGQGPEAATAAARAELLERFPGATDVYGGATAEFVLSGYYWAEHVADWTYSAGAPESLPSPRAAIERAANTWVQSGGSWAFTDAGDSDAATGGCTRAGRDDANTVGWVDLPGSTLALTCVWYSFQPPYLANEFDMEIDPGWSWTNSTDRVQVDLESVVLHEFGHAFGLEHTDQRCPGPVMCAIYNSGRLIRTLTDDDREAIVQLYGLAPTPVPSPTATPSPTVTPTPIPIVRGPLKSYAPGVSRD